MAQTDNFIKVMVDEAQTQITADSFIICCIAYSNIYSGPVYVTVNPLDNNATVLSNIKTQVVAAVNAATRNLRNYVTTNCSVWGSFN